MSSASDRQCPRLGEIVRSVVFYAAFYGGTVPIVLAALVTLPFSTRAFKASVHSWSRYHRFCARVLLGIGVRCEGRPSVGAVLYALRHESFFEAIDLPTLLPEPVVFAKAELLRLPFWGAAGLRYGLVPVERDQGARALRAMVTAAKSFAATGRPLAIFPEGTRVAPGSSPPLQAGFAGLYKLIGLPVVPVAVASGGLYHRWWKRPGTVVFRFGEPIPAGLSRNEIEERVRTAIDALNPRGD
ncbi:MAG: lysophospholipid acyltransferase family protein [Novosphingobium sp.]